MRNKMLRMLGVAALIGSTGCLSAYEPADPNSNQPAQGESGPERTTASNMSSEPLAVRPIRPEDQSGAYLDSGDPAVLAARAAEEGPLDVSSRRHACMKMKFETLGNLLKSHGVNMTLPNGQNLLPVTLDTDCDVFLTAKGVNLAATPNERTSYTSQVSEETRFLYCDSRLSLGYPQLYARLPEATSPTTASATKLADVFVTAAQEIINAMQAGRVDACKDETGRAAVLFNNDGSCNKDGITCLLGYPATADQLALCNRIVSQAGQPDGVQQTMQRTVTILGVDTRPDQGNAVRSRRNMTIAGSSAVDNARRIAVGAILTAAHSCE